MASTPRTSLRRLRLAVTAVVGVAAWQQPSLATPEAAPCRCDVNRVPSRTNAWERVTKGGRQRLARQWHARGQGFKSSQLHQQNASAGLPLTAVCQQGTLAWRQRCRSWLGHVRTPEGPVPSGSQPPRCSSRSRSSTRRILPEMVLGSSSVNSISRGYL